MLDFLPMSYNSCVQASAVLICPNRPLSYCILTGYLSLVHARLNTRIGGGNFVILQLYCVCSWVRASESGNVGDCWPKRSATMRATTRGGFIRRRWLR
jgi:hypothetical protein